MSIEQAAMAVALVAQAVALVLLARLYRKLQRRCDSLFQLAMHAHVRIGDTKDEVESNAEELREMQEWVVGEDRGGAEEWRRN